MAIGGIKKNSRKDFKGHSRLYVVGDSWHITVYVHVIFSLVAHCECIAISYRFRDNSTTSIAHRSPCCCIKCFFGARQHAQRAIWYRLSVCLSVTRVDHTKTVEVRIIKFSPLVCAGYEFHPEILRGSPKRGLQRREGWENQPFSSFNRQCLENGSSYGQSYY